MFGYPRAITLNSEGEQYDLYYVHDQGSYGAKWLKSYINEETLYYYLLYSDFYGINNIISQTAITRRISYIIKGRNSEIISPVS